MVLVLSACTTNNGESGQSIETEEIKESIDDLLEELQESIDEAREDFEEENEPQQDEDEEEQQADDGQQKEVENDHELTNDEQEVINLTNEEREANGLSPLELDTELAEVATVKSEDMRDNDYFSHQSPVYGSPFDLMDEYDVDFRMAGENIAMGQQTPEQVVEGWMDSEGHRENILNEGFTHIGVGHVDQDGPGGGYWTQMFLGR
ncbi:CAP domain-containing protein [Salicibibacter kimchii]|uniref:CAP domain-containing protein n=1 Tax=Salicibibacter kimchii TaxID=2099786 RepID=UPI001D04ADDB|nr:CAP domain-containing protein [Salicibibacter kimchii]